MEKVKVTIAITDELLRCGVLDRVKSLVPGCVDNFVAGKALLLRADEVLKKGMQRLKAQPSHLPLMVEVPLRVGEKGAVVKHSDSTD